MAQGTSPDYEAAIVDYYDNCEIDYKTFVAARSLHGHALWLLG